MQWSQSRSLSRRPFMAVSICREVDVKTWHWTLHEGRSTSGETGDEAESSAERRIQCLDAAIGGVHRADDVQI